MLVPLMEVFLLPIFNVSTTVYCLLNICWFCFAREGSADVADGTTPQRQNRQPGRVGNGYYISTGRDLDVLSRLLYNERLTLLRGEILQTTGLVSRYCRVVRNDSTWVEKDSPTTDCCPTR